MHIMVLQNHTYMSYRIYCILFHIVANRLFTIGRYKRFIPSEFLITNKKFVVAFFFCFCFVATEFSLWVSSARPRDSINSLPSSLITLSLALVLPLND